MRIENHRSHYVKLNFDEVVGCPIPRLFSNVPLGPKSVPKTIEKESNPIYLLGTQIHLREQMVTIMNMNILVCMKAKTVKFIMCAKHHHHYHMDVEPKSLKCLPQ